MAKYLLELPGVKAVLSNRLCCQDQVKQFFGKQRQRGGTNDNPNISQFENNTSTIRIADSVIKSSSHENCNRSQRSKPGDLLITSNENEPLPKRPRHNKKEN